MIGLGEYWFALVIVIGVLYTAWKLFTGERGVAAHAEAGKGGGALGNAVPTMLSAAAIAYIGRDVINNGPLTQVVGGLIQRLLGGS